MSKNIILCSDGTGYKGGYGADTNVYKLYKAVDIHNDKYPQITYYDNGVGARENQNKYVQKLGKAFGFGFQGNIGELYEFLALNYNPGDGIYLFGFSRGGATVRAFLGLLYACGLLNRYDKDGKEKTIDQLQYDIKEALKAYEQISVSRQAVSDFKENKALHDDKHVPKGNLPIQFVGVWDTVSGLGFPKDWSFAFSCFFRLLDNVSDKIWPHNYYDYELNSTIKHAYQALSIDDERKTFQPMVWNETANNFAGEVEQVWFSGMHSNVGGGYARTGLSDIAMDWMLVRATQHGLVLKAGMEEAFQANADTYDYLYDSREGIASYYRYEPRDIVELSQTENGKNKLSGKVKIHNTVMQRIEQGTADYAPGLLPNEFDVVETPLKSAVTHVQVDKDNAVWQDNKNKLLNYVNQREWLYRIFAELSLAVVLISGYLWMNLSVEPQSQSGLNVFERFFGHIADVLEYITPAFFENFIHTIVRVYSWIFVALVAAIMAMVRWRKHLKHELSEVSKKLCHLLLQNYK